MSDYKRIQEMLYGLPNTQPVYTQLGTTTVDLDEMRAEIARLQAREAKLREALQLADHCIAAYQHNLPNCNDETERIRRTIAYTLRKEGV
jgi:septal ring factor EnvC (AmiA/AmiB activator)